jgi:glycosyltransferase 2 family protein
MIRKAPEHHSYIFRFTKRSILQIVAVLILVVLIIPQLSSLKESLMILRSINLSWLAVGFSAVVTSVFCAAGVYIALVPARLPVWRTALIQTASFFTNKLLPSGLGGIGFNALYLVKQTSLSRTDSAVYATANNLIGFLAFWITALIIQVFSRTDIQIPRIHVGVYVGLAVFVIILAASTVLSKSINDKFISWLGHIWGVLITITKHPKRLVLAVLSSAGITTSTILLLWISAQAVGLDLSLATLSVIFVIGNTALAISPTPGGIGPVEAAMAIGFVNAGAPTTQALAAVTMFRLFTYWLPIVPGLIAYRHALKKEYV